jgi:hypothetical protein
VPNSDEISFPEKELGQKKTKKKKNLPMPVT